MESSLQRAENTVNDTSTALNYHREAMHAEEEHHISLPNPSWWPVFLSFAILVAVVGLLFIPDNPWLLIVSAPFVLLGILGWALEDPMASSKEVRLPSLAKEGNQSRFYIGQEVIDRDGNEVGTVEARFSHSILVNIGTLVRPAYIPLHLIEDVNPHFIRLSINEFDRHRLGLQNVPDDLYEVETEYDVPVVNGMPMFASSPLSPAETGHYNYGPYFPGINTDATGSYYPEEVRPIPQKYVNNRRNFYANRKKI